MPGWFHGTATALSEDGIHWSEPTRTTQVGDNSSFFYNPFRRVWCMSIRRSAPITGLRCRYYHESDGFIEGAQWNTNEEVFWQRTDRLDLADPDRPHHRVAL